MSAYNACDDLIGRNIGNGRGDKVAVIDRDGSHSYQQLQNRIDRFAQLLDDRNVERGQRIVLCLLDTVDFPACFLGAIKAGVVAVPVVVHGFHFPAGEFDILGVSDDHEVTGIDMRGVDRLVFAHQHDRDLGSQSTEHSVRGIDMIPLLGHLARLGYVAVRSSDRHFLSPNPIPGIAPPDVAEAVQSIRAPYCSDWHIVVK